MLVKQRSADDIKDNCRDRPEGAKRVVGNVDDCRRPTAAKLQDDDENEDEDAQRDDHGKSGHGILTVCELAHVLTNVITSYATTTVLRMQNPIRRHMSSAMCRVEKEGRSFVAALLRMTKGGRARRAGTSPTSRP